MRTFKRIFGMLICISLTVPVFAQTQDTVMELQKNNIVKINLSALVIKSFSVEYERKIAKKITLAANVHYTPFGKLPFVKTIEDYIDDPAVPVDQVKWGSFGIAPEIRFYVGKKGAFRGFYIAPFGNFTNYKADLPINYNDETKTGIFSGNISTITGGLLFGAQWKLTNTVYLDWWIIGPNYGGAKGELNLNTTLTASEQTDMKGQIENLKADAPFDKIIESYEVNGTGAFIKASGPWAGLRGFGINLGFRF